MYQGRLYAVPDYSHADLLYYRTDLLAKAGKQPPKTWAQLQQLAETVAPEYGLYGYAGTFAPYEGLTVNFAEAVQSAGGSILSPEGTKVTGRRSVSRWRLTTALAGSAPDGAAARPDDRLTRWHRVQPPPSGARRCRHRAQPP